MSKRKRHYIRDQNLGPVKLALVQRWEGGQLAGVDGIEVTFRESAPDMRNRLKFWLLFALLLLGMCAAIYLFVVGFFTMADWWGRGFDYLVRAYPDFVVASFGTVIFIFLCFKLRPPFYAPVRVFMSPENDGFEVYRHGRLVERVKLSEVRGVGVEPHPKLEDALIWAEANPKRSDRTAMINKYRGAQLLFAEVGAGVTEMKIEVAAFREGKTSQTPMQARAAIALGAKMAEQLQRQAAGQEPLTPAAEPMDLQPVRTPGRRRRRGKIE